MSGAAAVADRHLARRAATPHGPCTVRDAHSACDVTGDGGSAVDADAEVGDPVCWVDQLCPECGAMPTADEQGRCWRCGTPAPAEPD